MEITGQTIKDLIREGGIDLEVEGLADDGDLRAQGADSLIMMDVFLVVEQHFGIKIPDGDIRSLRSVNDIAAYVRDSKGA